MGELDDVINVPREKLWAQAMLFACDVTNKSVTTSTVGVKSLYELWLGKFPTADHLRPFGAVGYARRGVRAHKMAQKAEKCVFIGVPRNFSTGTVGVLLVRTINIVKRQAVQWVDGPKKTGGDGTGSDDRCMKSAEDGTIVGKGTPQLNVQELGQEQQLTLHEHATQEAFLEHEGETQEQQQKEGEARPASGSANLKGSALPALRKQLTIDGNISRILLSRTRSRRPHTGVEGAALHCFLPVIEVEGLNGVKVALACDNGGQMAMQAMLDVPEPRNRRQTMESPEWDEWRKAVETKMLGMVGNCVYKKVARPKDKLVVSTKTLYKRKIRQDGKVEKYKCRLVAQGFWPVEGVH